MGSGNAHCSDVRTGPGRAQTVPSKQRSQAVKPGSLWSANAPTAPLPQPEGLPAAPPEGHQEPPLLLKAKSLHSFPHFCRSLLFILRLFVQSAESQIIT